MNTSPGNFYSFREKKGVVQLNKLLSSKFVIHSPQGSPRLFTHFVIQEGHRIMLSPASSVKHHECALDVAEWITLSAGSSLGHADNAGFAQAVHMLFLIKPDLIPFDVDDRNRSWFKSPCRGAYCRTSLR